jgi:chemotaxis signal transduction protein
MPTSLQFRLQSGAHGIPLRRVHRVTGFASLAGEEDDYFLGWLNFHGTAVPVWDLNRVVCDAPTLEQFGARIILLEPGWHASIPYVGLLAAAVTDTCADDDPAVKALDIDLYLQMLANLIPPPPAEQR